MTHIHAVVSPGESCGLLTAAAAAVFGDLTEWVSYRLHTSRYVCLPDNNDYSYVYQKLLADGVERQQTLPNLLRLDLHFGRGFVDGQIKPEKIFGDTLEIHKSGDYDKSLYEYI